MQAAVSGTAYLFHTFLVGGIEATKSADPRELVVNLHLYGMLDSVLDQPRTKDPRKHRVISAMKAQAPSGNVLTARMKAYKEVLETDSKRSLQNVGARFSTYCQAEYDPVVQLIGSGEFSRTLKAAKEYVAAIALRLPS